MDAIVDSKVEIHQEKYENKTFYEKVDVSQNLVHNICFHLRAHDIFARGEDDVIPFTDKNGKSLRLCDAMAIDPQQFKILFFEAKDHARLIKYDATGQPKMYIDNKLKLLNGGEDVYILFRENIELARARAKIRDVSLAVIIYGFVEEGLAKIRDDGSIYFVPYGHNLKFLLQEENRELGLERWLKSHLSAYCGEKQYLWKTKVMLPIDKLIVNVIK